MKNKVLVVAAHSDDEVLGCGGVISKLTKLGHEVTVVFMTDGVGARSGNGVSGDNCKNAKKRARDSKDAAEVLGISRIEQFDFPDNALDSIPILEITKVIEGIIETERPKTVFTHFLDDLNVDHSVVARATLTATRPIVGTCVKRVFGFEVNSSTEWYFGNSQFSPNYFVDITSSFESKLEAIRKYRSELKNSPHPRSIEGIKALASLRGNAAGYKYAEAFFAYRLLED